MEISNSIGIDKTGKYFIKELFEKYYEKVYKTAYIMLLNSDTAKDATQEAFLKALKGIDKLNDINKFEPWINMIVTNTCRNMVKKTQYQNKKIALYDNDEEMKYNIQETNEYYIPGKQLEDNELKNELNKYIGQLNHDEQYILYLRFQYELSYEKIAEYLKLKEGTIKSKVCRAKKKIYSEMQGYYYTNGTEKISKKNRFPDEGIDK